MIRATRSTLIISMLVGVLVLVAVGFGAAAALYDQWSRVAADCDERFGDNSPARWSVRGIGSAVPELDGSPYFVADYRQVHIPSRDPGIDLRAWWVPPPDGADAPGIIAVHGFGTCVRDPAILAPAGMLHRLGYGVLLVDLRDHGASTIEDGRTAGGTEEYRDVMGAVDWLIGHGVGPGRIGVLGTSMGAATAIMAAGQDDRIAGVWADSAYADLVTRIADGLEAEGLPRFLTPVAVLVARLVAGDGLDSPSVLGEVTHLAGRHLFLVHGSLDGLIDVSHATTLAKAARSAGVLTDRWIVADAGHVDAMLVHPEEYQRRLGGFFGTALASPG